MTVDGTSATSPTGGAVEALWHTPLSFFQRRALVIFFLLYALDGYDMLSLAFALPGIRTSMHLDPVALGAIISVGLIGTGVGSLFISPLGDRYGRKALMTGCLAASFLGMLCCASAGGATMLASGRFATGIGVGGLLPAVTALAIEYTPLRLRSSAAAFVTIGYPAGGVIGGALASVLLHSMDWRSVFAFGAGATMFMLVVTLRYVPESIEFLAMRNRPSDLDRVNTVFSRIGLAPVARLAGSRSLAPKGSVFDVIRPALLPTTLIVTAVYALHGATFYYSVNWLSKIATDLSLTPAQAATIVGWCSGGGMLGAGIVAWMAPRVDIRLLTPLTLTGAGLCLILLPLSGGALPWASALLGACLYGGQASLYASMMRAFPVHVRATGAGFVTGVGRLGGIVSPTVSGMLFAAGLGNFSVGAVMAAGSLSGAAFWILMGLARRGSSRLGSASA